MPDFVASARAASNGAATVLIQHNKSGIVWVVSQISVRSDPVRNTASCRVSRNGQQLTSSALVPSTAAGQPFYRLNAADALEIAFANLQSGDFAYVTVSYSETQWGQYNDGTVI